MNQTQQMLIAGSVFISLTLGFHYYLYRRLIYDAGLSSPWREIATVLLVLLAVSIPLTFFLSRAVRFDLFRILSLGPYTWIGTMMLLIFAFVTIDLLYGILFVATKLGAPSVLPTDPSRRQALGRMLIGGTALTASVLTGIAVLQAARKPIVKRVEILLSRLSKKASGFKIVQISDLHVGATADGGRLAEVVKQVNALKPDIIAITGDLVDGETHFLKKEIEAIRELQGGLGVYFITGNHEYYSGAGAWIAEIKRLSVRVLRNEAVKIGDGDDAFYLAGVDDYASKGMLLGHGQDIPKAIRDIPKDKAVILLAHQPKAVREASDLGVDLVLSGHTHGGQIWPFSYLVPLQQPYNKGLHRHSESTQIYVNQGTLTWGPPMRLGSESEITEIVLLGNSDSGRVT